MEAAFRELGGISVLLKTLERHADDGDVVEVLSASLHQLVNVSETSRRKMVELNGMKTLVVVMQRQAGSPLAIEELCR